MTVAGSTVSPCVKSTNVDACCQSRKFFGVSRGQGEKPPESLSSRTGPDYDFFITILRHFFYDFTAFFYDFVTMLREHSLPYRPMFSLIFKPKNWQ